MCGQLQVCASSEQMDSGLELEASEDRQTLGLCALLSLYACLALHSTATWSLLMYSCLHSLTKVWARHSQIPGISDDPEKIGPCHCESYVALEQRKMSVQ